MGATVLKNPFPGLRPFEADETHLFFGRDGQSSEIVMRLAQERFVAVVGTSGSGKSSLVRAGLLPLLEGGYMGDAGSFWRLAVLRPGDSPIRNLALTLSDAAVLGSAAGEAAVRGSLMEAVLRRSSLGLVDAFRQARLEPHENLLVVVDQFEEIFRFGNLGRAGERLEEAAAFVKLLLEATDQREVPIYVVITMRSDFLGDCAQFRDLPATLNDGQYLIPRMTRDQRREAIVGPVAVGGATIAPRLVQRLLNDVGDDPDHLPVLQHALMRTWESWQSEGRPDAPIDLHHYAAVGEFSRALSNHADQAYGELPDERIRLVAKRLFQRLCERGIDNRETRRPTKLGEVCAAAGAELPTIVSVIDAFRTGGRTFLVPPAPAALDGDSVIDISHEALIRQWGKLREWVAEEFDSAATYLRLSQDASLHAEGKTALWRNPALQLALTWRRQRSPNSAWAKRYDEGFERTMSFLDASARAEGRRRWKIWAGVGLILVVLLGTVVAWSWNAHRNHEKLLGTNIELEKQTKVLEKQTKALEEQKGALEEQKEKILESEKEASRLADQAVKGQTLANGLRRRAESRELTAHAENIVGQDPELATLLALEALSREDTSEARVALLHAARFAWPNATIRDSRQIGGSATAIALTSDGSRLAVLSDVGQVTLWDVTTRAPRKLWHSSQARKEPGPIAFRPDDARVAVGQEGSVELLDAATGLPTATVPRPEGTIHTIAFSPDGRTIALAMKNMIWLWTPNETGVDPSRTEEIMVKDVLGVEFHSDPEFQSLIAVAEKPLRALRMQKTADGKWPDTPVPVNVQGCVSPQSISPGIGQLSATFRSSACTYTGKDLTIFEPLRSDDRVVEDIVWSQKGTAHVQVLKDPEAIVHFLGGIESRIKGIYLPKLQTFVRMVAVSDDGRRLAAIAPGQGIRIYSLGEQKIFLAELGSRLTVSQDGTWIALAEGDRLGSYFTTDHARRRAISISVPGAIERIEAAGGMLIATVRGPDKKSARLLAYDARSLKLAYELPLNEDDFQLFGENKEIVWIPPAPDGDSSTGRFLRTVDGRAVSVVPETGRRDRVFPSIGARTMAICRVTEPEQEQCRPEVFSVEEGRLVSRGTIPPVSTGSILVPSDDGQHVLERQVLERRLRRGATSLTSRLTTTKDLVVWRTLRDTRAVPAEPIWSLERSGAEGAHLLDGGRLLISRGPTLEIHELDGARRGAAVIIEDVERKHLSPGATYAVKPVAGASEASMGHGVVRLKTGETVLRLSSGKIVKAWFSSDDRCLAIKQEKTLEFYDLQRGRRLARFEGLADAEKVEFVGGNRVAVVARRKKAGNILVPLDESLAQDFAQWLVAGRELTGDERCEYMPDGKGCAGLTLSRPAVTRHPIFKAAKDAKANPASQ